MGLLETVMARNLLKRLIPGAYREARRIVKILVVSPFVVTRSNDHPLRETSAIYPPKRDICTARTGPPSSRSVGRGRAEKIFEKSFDEAFDR
jgi:hypothetical protein